MLSFISISDAEKWDNIVKSFKEYDAYYLSGYAKAFQIHGDGDPELIYFENKKMRALNVVMKRDITCTKHFTNKLDTGKYFDLSTPYGYGGFILEGGDDVEELDSEYTAYCIKNNIITEFVRFHPLLKNKDKLHKMYSIKDLGKTIVIDLTSKAMIWDNFSSKNRNMVRKAQKSGVRIYWGRSQELFESFVSMYNSTMDRDNAIDYYYFDKLFYESILDDFKYNSLIFYAVYNNEIISMSIIIYSNQKIHYHLSASNRAYQSFAPTNLLLYEVACWGCDNGYKLFHLGGGVGSEEDNLYKFKSAFNKNSNGIYSIGRKIFNHTMYDRLVLLREDNGDFDNQSSFFPLYRA